MTTCAVTHYPYRDGISVAAGIAGHLIPDAPNGENNHRKNVYRYPADLQQLLMLLTEFWLPFPGGAGSVHLFVPPS